MTKGSYIKTRKYLAGVDTFSFERWASHFVEDFRSRTTHHQNFLLLNDGYRSQVSLKALEVLKRNNKIAYALSSHTSATTQPLDVSVFNSFNHFTRKSITAASKCVDTTNYCLFGLFVFMRDAYERSYTRETYVLPLQEQGLIPLLPGICCPFPILFRGTRHLQRSF